MFAGLTKVGTLSPPSPLEEHHLWICTPVIIGEEEMIAPDRTAKLSYPYSNEALSPKTWATPPIFESILCSYRKLRCTLGRQMLLLIKYGFKEDREAVGKDFSSSRD